MIELRSSLLVGQNPADLVLKKCDIDGKAVKVAEVYIKTMLLLNCPKRMLAKLTSAFRSPKTIAI